MAITFSKASTIYIAFSPALHRGDQTMEPQWEKALECHCFDENSLILMIAILQGKIRWFLQGKSWDGFPFKSWGRFYSSFWYPDSSKLKCGCVWYSKKSYPGLLYCSKIKTSSPISISPPESWWEYGLQTHCHGIFLILAHLFTNWGLAWTIENDNFLACGESNTYLSAFEGKLSVQT